LVHHHHDDHGCTNRDLHLSFLVGLFAECHGEHRRSPGHNQPRNDFSPPQRAAPGVLKAITKRNAALSMKREIPGHCRPVIAHLRTQNRSEKPWL
jgi:hypothetical protein